MRQTLKDRRKQLQRGMPMPRLLTMCLMLAILALIFTRLRDPNTWRWFARDNDEIQVVADNDPTGPATHPIDRTDSTSRQPAPQQPAPAASSAASEAGKAPPNGPPAASEAGKTSPPKGPPAPPAELTPTGPTDLDPAEQERIKNSIMAVIDGEKQMTRLDMPAYYQILSWVDHQSTALLRKRAKRDVVYREFRWRPDSMRLQIVELNLNVRQIIGYANAPKNGITEPIRTHDGHPLYEVWGSTSESGSNLYLGVVTDLPKGMPIGPKIDVHAKLVGYFFKLQGYISQEQQFEAERTRKKPTDLKAPMILGRLVWVAEPVVAEEKAPVWIFAAIGSLAVVVVVGWVWFSTRRARPRLLPATVSSAGLDSQADHWLDQAQSGRLSLERVPETTSHGEGGGPEGGFGDRLSGNSFWDNNESNHGHGSNNGPSSYNGSGDLGPEVQDTQ